MTCKNQRHEDRRKQWDHRSKEDLRSPSVAIMLSCLIDSIVDIPGVFMQADKDEEVVCLRLYWRMSDLLTEISSDTYHQYICTMEDEPTLFLSLREALYGATRTAYMFSRKSKTMCKWRLLTNP